MTCLTQLYRLEKYKASRIAEALRKGDREQNTEEHRKGIIRVTSEGGIRGNSPMANQRNRVLEMVKIGFRGNKENENPV